jgi:hypothetical protein
MFFNLKVSCETGTRVCTARAYTKTSEFSYITIQSTGLTPNIKKIYWMDMSCGLQKYGLQK